MYNEKLKTADTRTSSDLAPNVSTVENSLGCCALLAGAGSSGHCLEWPARPRARLQRLQQRRAHLGRLRELGLGLGLGTWIGIGTGITGYGKGRGRGRVGSGYL